jgi:DNA-binding Xre family transcriptional regulator
MEAIAPQDINLCALPSVLLADRKQLPQTAGIYFAIDGDGVVQYIGQSTNLRQRWLNHHRKSALDGISNVQIAWIEVSEPSLLREIEEALIEYFNPPLNGLIRKESIQSDGKTICKLKELMKKEGLNQLQLSEATGLSPTTVGNLYRNRFSRIDVSTLKTLCKYFRVGIEGLFEVVFEEEDIQRESDSA